MSNRTLFKAIGLVLLVPSALLGLLPVIFANTGLGDAWSDRIVTLNDYPILTITHTVDGIGHAAVTPYVWVVAALGEIILIAVHVLKPVRKSRYSVGLS